MTEVQELVARLRLRDEMSGPIRKVRAGISGVSDALNSPRMQKGISQIGTGLRNSAIIGAAGIGILATQVAAGLRSLVELEQQQAQTNAVIESTGGIAGITGQKVSELSEKFESLNATIGDETIREAQNMLLTFTNIREDAFEPTLQAVLDMNTALGKGPDGLANTAILVGKAINDPIRGLTALTRVGVSFTEGQRDQIKALVEAGDTMAAQRIILAELNKEFGGSFLAQGGTTAGKVAKFQDSIEDLQRAMATALLPTIGKIADRLSSFLQDPAVIRGAEELGESIAGLFSDENLDAAAATFKSVFQAAKDAAPTIAAAAKITAEVVKTAVGLFRSLPPEIQKLAIGAFAINKLTGGLVTNIAGGLISSVLKQLVSGVVNVNGAVVNVNGAAGVPAAGGAAGAAGKGGASKVGTALNVILPLAAAAVIGDAIIEATGGSTQGQGRVVGAIGEVEVVIGRSMAANGAAVTGAIKDSALYQGGKAESTAARLVAAANRTKDDTVAAVNRHSALEGQRAAQERAAVIDAGIRASAATRSAATQTRAALDAAKVGIIGKVGSAASAQIAALKAKRLSFTANLSVTNNVSVKETIKTQTTFKKLGGSVAL